MGAEAAAVHLVNTLKDSDHIGRAESKILNETIGAFPASAASKCCHIIQNIVSLLPENTFLYLKKILKKPTDGQEKVSEFGVGIKFYAPRTEPTPHESLISESDSDNEGACTLESQWLTKWEDCTTPESSHGTDLHSEVDNLWLRTQLEKEFGDRSSGDLSVMDLCSVVFDVLSSAKDDAEIQNELFDLLGFDHFEFIQGLLIKRRTIIEATHRSASSLASTKGKSVIKECDLLHFPSIQNPLNQDSFVKTPPCCSYHSYANY